MVEAFLGGHFLFSLLEATCLSPVHRGGQDQLSWPRDICVGFFLMGFCGAQVGRHGHGPTWVRQTLSVFTSPSLRLKVCMCVCVCACVYLGKPVCGVGRKVSLTSG